MQAFYMSLTKPTGNHKENNFRIWRSHNHNVRMNLDGNKLAHLRRDKNMKRLTDFEFGEVKVKDIDSGNVGIRDGDIDDRNKGAGGVSCTDADTRVARIIYVQQKENVNHIGALDDIPIDEPSEDEFELVGEGNHYVSCHTKGRVTLKNKRVIELEQKLMMLNILHLETKLLKLLKKLKLLV